MKMLVLAGAVAATAVAPPLASAGSVRQVHVRGPVVKVAGTAPRSLSSSHVIGATPASTPVRVAVFLKPRHATLLAQMASSSSGRPGLSPRLMNGLFGPSALVRAQVSAYMRSQGFRPIGSGVLTQSFLGTAAQAERAFAVSLDQYRSAGGKTFRSPSGSLHLPAALAHRVITVDGLSTQPLMHPAGLHKGTSKLSPKAALTGCTGSNNVQSANPGSLQPQDLAAAIAYNSQTLLDNGDDGTGESVALVEFSNYNGSDQQTFQSCYGLTIPVQRVKVHGGTSDKSGNIEVALDQEVVASQATGLANIFTYVAPQSASQAGVLDAILRGRKATHVHIVSDSWGACEPFLFEATQAANNAELQLMAVAGMSFFVASGDDGSTDCHRRGFDGLAVDDPASQPYATGVGGTNLNPGTSESAWGGGPASHGGGGGGVSLSFLKPTWQAGPGVIRTGLSSKKVCGGKTHYCREVPDVAFNADPQTGYVIFDGGSWDVVGGTSAAAPLMAAFTADANRFSLQNGGGRMGFANPFLYHQFEVHPTMFNDVTNGSNNIFGGAKYHAAAGYDMATGLGSIDAASMATRLALFTRKLVHIQGTKITASASRNPVSAGHPTVLSGKLVDTTTHRALAGRVVWVEGLIGNSQVFIRLHTGRKGGWSKRLTRRQIPKKFVWHAVYVGEQGHRPAISPTRVLHVA